jgi:ribosome maturation factor RimP
VGRLVTLTPHGGQPLTGRVVAADGPQLRLEVEGQPLELQMAEVGPGRVQVEFSRPGAEDLAEDAEDLAEDDFEDDTEPPDRVTVPDEEA